MHVCICQYLDTRRAAGVRSHRCSLRSLWIRIQKSSPRLCIFSLLNFTHYCFRISVFFSGVPGAKLLAPLKKQIINSPVAAHKRSDGGRSGNGGNITINGGEVTATGGNNGACIGGGSNCTGGSVTINGGFVGATGDSGSFGIGEGSDYQGTDSKFKCWKDGETIVSYSSEFNFIVTKSMDLVAEYVDNDTVVEEEPLLSIRPVKDSVNGTLAVRLTFDRSIPYSYDIKEVGIIYTTNKLLGNTEVPDEILDITAGDLITCHTSEPDKVRVRSVETNKCNGTIDLLIAVGEKTDAVIYATGYAVIEKDGISQTVYIEDICITSYNKAAEAH